MNFDNVFPYCDIKEVTIDGQSMIWYPKTYVRAIDLPAGQYKGKYAWQISQRPANGFHVHRAFIDSNGQERDGFYLGAYEASTNNGVAQSLKGWNAAGDTSYNAAVDRCKKRNTDNSNQAKTGWHLETCFEYFFVTLLMLIELGSADVQATIDTGNITKSDPSVCGSTKAIWRGLHDHWADQMEACDGIKTNSSGTVLVWDRSGEHYVSTGKRLADSGFAKGSGAGYDLSDVFLPGSDTGGTFSATTSDALIAEQGYSNKILVLGGSWYRNLQSGMFFVSPRGLDESHRDSGYRLAKY